MAGFRSQLGEIINGITPEQHSDQEITFFKTVGMATEDTTAAMLTEAEKMNWAQSSK